MIIEMRTYKTKPGQRGRFLEIFRGKTIPAHDEIGMKILGPFLSIEDPDTFFFMRGFPDLALARADESAILRGQSVERGIGKRPDAHAGEYEAVLVDDPEGLIRW